MKSTKSSMGRRQFLVTAGVASASALAANTLTGLIGPDIATAAEMSTGTAKCAVVYSSMTGNTEKAAKAIRKGLEAAAGSCDIFPMKDANPYKMGGYDLIALGWPLMGPRLKLDVKTFFTNLRYVGGRHVILFSTSDSSDNNHAQCLPLLRDRDAITIGSKSWHSSVYGPLGDPTPGRWDGHPDRADLEDAANWAKEKWELSRKIYAGDTSLIPAEPTRTGERPSGVLPGGRAMHPDLIGLENDTPEELKKRIHFELIYEQDKCMFPTCSRCMDFCPVHGIDFTVSPRVYGDPCMMCMMCDQVCPTGALSVNPEQMKWQRKVEYYGDDVTQVYQAYPKRPRFIVGYGRPYGYDPYTREDRGSGK